MPNGGISIEDYLRYLDQQSARNLGQVDDQAPVGQQVRVPRGGGGWGTTLAKAAGVDVVQEVTSENAALDFLGSLAWGGIRGLTWGASEFVAKSKPWEHMSDS